MTNKYLKNFRNAITDDLKIKPKGNCFVIIEEKEKSKIKKIEFTLKNQDDFLILRQIENKHTLNLLNSFSTNESCDFIVFRIFNNELIIYYSEIKSSYNEENKEKALKQIESSKLFIDYLLSCYLKYHKANITTKKEFFLYIYPKIGISNKNNFCKKTNLIFKDVEISDKENGIVRISENKINEFFKTF
ncbi:hypothetical protein DYR41_07215 [Campylobacter jejuni]|uniref:hypothetical protein n=1 Tax=Campylobacter jejuni TaxID=197 RepID=UPI00105961DC|nr:hypothetical protein [Campylobacter jejuni]EAI3889861.1 hypothetical protein [Campylobacter jejuni]EAI3890859.1 hypothetical protein [Campylobacter jejuni]EAI3979285.1 hypothetical protein [Campylobacter jejuni]EAI3980467.1 hypothetical protein [Campylobacter jejuni]EAI3982930.1 hypothetical protein [Campylobacter jejuni]